MRNLLMLGFAVCLVIARVGYGGSYLPPPSNPSKVVPVKPDVETPWLAFEGNLAIADAALRDVADLAYREKPSAQAMPNVISALYNFYLKAGYDLIRLEYQRAAKGWIIYIDEGILTDIQIFGLGWQNTFALQNSVLRGGIFNRKQLEEQLGEWYTKMRVKNISYELVRKRRAADLSANQFIAELSETLRSKNSLDRRKSRWGVDLRIYFERDKKYGQLNFGTGYSSDYGLEFEMEYAQGDWLLRHDQFETLLLSGLNTLRSIDPAQTSEDYVYVNLLSDTKWFMPSQSRLRTYLQNRAGLVTRQRVDLPLDRFQLLEVEDSLNFKYELNPYRYLYLSAGYEYQLVFDVDEIPTSPFAVTDDHTHAVFGGAGLEFIIGKPSIYRTLNHSARIDYRHLYRFDGDHLDLLHVRYKWPWLFRFADFVWNAHGVLLLGDAEFFDEYPLEEIGFRTSFDRQFSVRKSINVRSDFRFNLYQKKLQFGPIQDFAYFEWLDRRTSIEEPVFAYAVGPAIFITIMNAFQFYMSYAWGFTSNSDTGEDFHLGLEKIF